MRALLQVEANTSYAVDFEVRDRLQALSLTDFRERIAVINLTMDAAENVVEVVNSTAASLLDEVVAAAQRAASPWRVSHVAKVMSAATDDDDERIVSALTNNLEPTVEDFEAKAQDIRADVSFELARILDLFSDARDKALNSYDVATQSVQNLTSQSETPENFTSLSSGDSSDSVDESWPNGLPLVRSLVGKPDACDKAKDYVLQANDTVKAIEDMLDGLNFTAMDLLEGYILGTAQSGMDKLNSSVQAVLDGTEHLTDEAASQVVGSFNPTFSVLTDAEEQVDRAKRRVAILIRAANATMHPLYAASKALIARVDRVKDSCGGADERAANPEATAAAKPPFPFSLR